MGRVRSIAALVAVASLTLFAAPAQATFHLNKVNEVMVSGSGGNTAVQFVEFFDQGGPSETFPPSFAPYKLVVFDRSGNKVGEQTLSAMGLSNARAAGRPYLVSTAAADAALGVTGDETLTAGLPPSAGQACYTSGPSDTPYSCITWGCISTLVSASAGTGTAQGGTPPAGTSAQRQPDDSIQIAPPTPKAANKAGTKVAGCPTTGGGGPAPSFRGVTLTTRKVTVPKSGKAPVGLHCPAGTGSCSGRLTLTAGGKKIGSASFKIADGATRLVKVKLSSSAKRTLATKRKLSTKASIKASAATGGTKTTSGTVKLVASKH